MGLVLTASPPGAGGPPVAAAVDILGIEIVQTVQNLNNDVALIRDKATLVRVYLNPHGFTAQALLQAEIAVSPSATTPAKYVASTGGVTVSATPYPGIGPQRHDLALSLNFVLPAEVLGWDGLSVTVKRVFTGSGDISPGTNKTVNVALVTAPPLRIKAIGLRYVLRQAGSPPQEIAPAAFHFDFLRSFLKRAYPVSTVEWSQIVVEADARFTPPFSGPEDANGNDPLWGRLLDIAHNQLSALRAKDVDTGTDPRTHYYGLVSDADKGLFFRGAAKDVPQNPDPSIVAVGPTGNPRQYSTLAWDTDQTYGDWYGSHELGHTFGRFHPGFCGQDASDPTFPYPDGRIGDTAHGDGIGLDFGDAALGLPMRVMTNEVCHDIMTYCDDQWISSYSYQAILARLTQEDADFAPVAGA